MEQVEQRTVTAEVKDTRVEGKTLRGFACLYNTESRDLGGFREVIAPGAFADVLDNDVYLTVNHSPDKVLARTTSGTLRLREEERGLAFEADLGDGPTAQDVRDQVRRGDVSGASFRFQVAPGGERWEGERRTLSRIGRLIDLSLATSPAYEGPRVELRSAPDTPDELRHAWRNDDQETTKMNDREQPRRGALAVEDRAGAEGQTIEERIVDAFRAIEPGEARALTTAANSGGPLTPDDVATYVWDKLRPASVALASGIRVIPTGRDKVVYPRLVSDVDPTWVGELQQIPEAPPGFSSMEAVPKKLAHRISDISNEVIDDSEPSVIDVLNGHMVTMLALKLDASIFEGNPAGNANSIRGLKFVGTQSIAHGGANGAALSNYDPIVRAVGMLRTANVPGPYAVAMHPDVLTELELLKEATGSQKQLEAPDNLPPIYTTSQLSTNETAGTSTNSRSVYVYAPGQIVLVRRKDATVELDRSRLFDKDASEMRATLRADLLVPNPVAIVRITGVTPPA